MGAALYSPPNALVPEQEPPIRPDENAAELALEDAQAEIGRLRETITEQAAKLHLFRGKDRWA